MVIIVAFVLEDGDIADDGETVCEASGDEELSMVIFGEFNGYVLSIGWRAFSDVNGYVKDCAFDTADKLGLSEGWALEVESTHDSVGGAGFIVLDEVDFGYFFIEFLLVVAFEEVTSCVFENSRLDDYQAFNICFYNFHG